MTTKPLPQIAYGKVLNDLSWRPFGREANLELTDDLEALTIRLSGVHFIAFRQSLHGPPADPIGPGCVIHYMDVVQDSALLRSFIAKSLGFASDVVLYDLCGHVVSMSQFVNPLHLALVSAAGHLDVIFETMHVIWGQPNGTGPIIDRIDK